MQNRVIVFFVICLLKSITINARCADPLKIALEELLAGATIEIVQCPPYATYYDAPCQYGCPSYSSQVAYESLSVCGMPLQPWVPIYESSCGQYRQCQGGIPPPPTCVEPFCQCGCQYAIPPPPTCVEPCCQCGSCQSNPCNPCGCNTCDYYPPCSCYRDVTNPCAVYEDVSTYILLDNYGCNCNCAGSQVPYIYFPEVEYPMGVMDIKPHYYGSCWCS